LVFGKKLKSKGSAEDEIGDGEAKLAKLRPMRVEMYGMNWNGSLAQISQRSNP